MCDGVDCWGATFEVLSVKVLSRVGDVHIVVLWGGIVGVQHRQCTVGAAYLLRFEWSSFSAAAQGAVHCRKLLTAAECMGRCHEPAFCS